MAMDIEALRRRLQTLVPAERIDGLSIENGIVHLALRATRAEQTAAEQTARDARALLEGEPGVREARVVLTAHREPPAPAAAPGPAKLLPNVGRIIAVASGKGGVGKSTCAVNLAVALGQMGLAVGLLDADVYGPSLPRMLGLRGKPEIRAQTMIPMRAWGISAMSIGFLVEEEQAMVWRGPMVMGALTQMIGQVEWGALDVLVIDMPPGTGDAQLTLSQKLNLTGAVIVSTPQDIALIDARRGVDMFGKVGVPILGIVENMSYFACPQCGHEAAIFGHGGAAAEAARLGVPFLGEVPLLLDVREAGDLGTPIVVSAPVSAGGRAFASIAQKVAGVWGGSLPPQP